MDRQGCAPGPHDHAAYQGNRPEARACAGQAFYPDLPGRGQRRIGRTIIDGIAVKERQRCPTQFLASSNTNEEDEMGDLRCALLGSFVAFAVAVPAWAGDVYVMEYSQGKKPVIVKKDSFTPADIPNMGEGKPNKGFSYTTAFELPGAAIQIARGHVDAKGTIAVHDGKQQYILYVIGGTGKLTLNDSKGETIGDITYKPDDIIVFQPNSLLKNLEMESFCILAGGCWGGAVELDVILQPGVGFDAG